MTPLCDLGGALDYGNGSSVATVESIELIKNYRMSDFMAKADDEVFTEALLLKSHELRVAYVQSACSHDRNRPIESCSCWQHMHR